MKHKPFETWIFSDEPLEPESHRTLYEHLRDCDSCYLIEKHWRQAEKLISAAPAAAPRPGFSARWQARLASERARTSRRQSLGMLGATSAAALISLFLFLDRITTAFAGSLEPAIETAAGWIGLLSAGLSAAAGAGPLPDAAALLLPALSIMLFCAGLGAASVAWLVMFRTLARVHGIERWA